MTLFAYLNGSDVGNKIRLNDMGLTSQADGSPGFGGIVFDDEAATLTVRGWMPVVVKETACVSAPVLFDGFVADRRYSRVGPKATYKTGSSRFVDTTLVDQNAVLHIRLITEPDGKRPAETHNARINWLTASAYLSGLIDDTSLVNTSNPRPFEEADYRGQFADDLLNDIAGPIFRTFFVWTTQPSGGRGLFFDVPDAVVGTSTLTISNVLSDNNATCFPPFVDAVLTRDPSEVYAKVRYTYRNGVVIENDASTSSLFFPVLGGRGLQVDNSRVGLESTARAMADRLLVRDGSENDTVTLTVQLPAASVGLIGIGQRIGVRFSHLPGFDPQVFTRVTARTITQAPDDDTLYNVELQLNTHGLSSVGGGGAPGTGTFPQTGAHFFSGSFTFMSDNYGSNGGSTAITPASNTTTSTTNTTKPTFAAGTTYNYSFTMTGNAADDPAQVGLGSNSGASFVWQTPHLTGLSYTAGTLTVTGSFTPVSAQTSYVTASIGAFAHVPHSTVVDFWIDPVGWGGSVGSQPPQSGQPIKGDIPTPAPGGGRKTFTTTWPYAQGSLHVYVDQTDQTSAVTETDPSAGTFTLAFDPRASELITCDYQGI